MQFLVEAELVQHVDGRDPIISLRDAGLREVDLIGANLIGADLSLAYLKGAGLFDADLSDVDLSGANLYQADLSGAEGITNEELEQQAASLVRTTMPNGQKYEDWLKDREKRQQDE